jgi:diaminohydroxyphosphoribosylaminopyrimidine deaminase / 5-amino-6-(5-phosphoribosylamino)uracil reductase
MRRCLDLALLGLGRTAPNPMVGAVIVHDGRIIGEGYHAAYGNAHAEVEAVRSVAAEDKNKLREATLYVNLEPCSHHGKTPPCVDLILQHEIQTVVVGAGDPNPLVNGKGLQRLRDAGVSVTIDVLREDCIALNKRFYMFYQSQRPYVVLKWAQSQDGFVAPALAQRVQLSNDLSRVFVHKWRSEEAAILVGFNTALVDDPELTTRYWPGKDPLRLVFDLKLKLPKTLKLFNGDVETWVLNHSEEKVESNVRYKKVSFIDTVSDTMDLLFQTGHNSLLVEGGTRTLESFIHQGVWDEARVFTAPMLLKKGLRAPTLPTFSQMQSETVGDNLLTVYTR